MTKNIFQKKYRSDLESAYRGFKGIIFDNVIGDIPDLQSYFEQVRKHLKISNRILVSYHNNLWEPILTLASKVGLRRKVGIQNWLDSTDLENVLKLSGFEIISSGKRFFGITTITIAKPAEQKRRLKKHSVSVIVPARNEAGNISKIVPSIPDFGGNTEIIFVEGNSTDKTWEAVSKAAKRFKHVTAYKQKGRGKADAVWLGFEKAKGDILMIYDADRTVDAKDLVKFYNALTEGHGKFANGSRLVYPMENQAMRTLNRIGNKVFSIMFTKILGQRFSDTLCGTKAFFRKDYLYMRMHNKKYFDTDPFGDFALIFSAIKNKLKVIEIPVRYRDRVYGSTNISRFRHGILLLKMTIKAFIEFKT